MSVFDSAKTVTALECAEKYTSERMTRKGRKTWCCCPIHGEKTASCSFDENGRFYCFGCHAYGTSIDFVAALFGMSATDAAHKICADFGLAAGGTITAAEVRKKKSISELRETVAKSASFTHAVHCGKIAWCNDRLDEIDPESSSADDELEMLLELKTDAENLTAAIRQLDEQRNEGNLYRLLKTVKDYTLWLFSFLDLWDKNCGTRYVAGVRA